MIAATLMVKIAAETSAFHTAMQQTQRAVRGSAQQMEQASSAVSALQSRMRTLNESFRIGRLTEDQFAAGVRTLKADIHELAAATELTAKSQQRLSQIGRQADGALRLVTAQAKRGADGFEAFGVATLAASNLAMGGLKGVGAAASQLQVFALGNPAMLGILAGLTAIASAFALIMRDTEGAAEALRGFDLQNLQRVRGRLAGIDTERTSLTAPMPPSRGPADLILQNHTRELRRARLAELLIEEARLRIDETRLRTATVPQPRSTPAGRTLPPSATPRVGAPDLGYLANAIPSPTDFKPFENSMDTATARMHEMKQAAKDLKPVMVDLGAVMASAVAGGISGLAAAFGNALTGTENFLQSMRRMLGSLLTSIGNALIAAGVGALKLFSALSSPVGAAAAIAAGIGLVVLGTAMGSSGGGATASSGGSAPTSSVGVSRRGSGASRTTDVPLVVQVVAGSTGEVLQTIDAGQARYESRGGTRAGARVARVQIDGLIVSRGMG